MIKAGRRNGGGYRRKAIRQRYDTAMPAKRMLVIDSCVQTVDSIA
ncbi:hypothetical protein [Prevotella sp.]